MTRNEALEKCGMAAPLYYDIIRFIKEFGYSPTLDELMQRNHIHSKKIILKRVRLLEEYGLITMELKKSRTICVRGFEYVDKGEMLEYGREYNKR